MADIFINYRDVDSTICAAYLQHVLAARFGADAVFLDSTSIQVGADFEEAILGNLRSARVLLAIIGPHWLTAVDAAGRRCIDSPRDWVRRELVLAFALDIRVIPVLLDQVRIPPESDLPADIAKLSRCQYAELRHRHSGPDLDQLADKIAAFLASATQAAPAPTVADPGPATGGTGPIVQHNEGVVVTGGYTTIIGSVIGRGRAPEN
jgi:hypothetical protein